MAAAGRRSPPPTPNPLARFESITPVSAYFPRPATPPPLARRRSASQTRLKILTRSRRPLLLSLLAFAFIVVLAVNFPAHNAPETFPDLNEAHSVADANRTAAYKAGLTFKAPAIDRLSALHGPPTARFRDNLRNDTKYVHSWISSGWTNDVLTYSNLIYMGLITDRVPIVHSFNWDPTRPANHGSHQMPFGAVFDLDRLSDAIGLPVLQWDEVKDAASGEVEELGCWNVWEAVQYADHRPRGAVVGVVEKQGLDIAWTRAPESVKIIPNYEHDKWARFWSLAALTYRHARSENLSAPKESEISHHRAPPDEHMACFDYLYYVSAVVSEEHWYVLSPVWRDVGRHMYWQPALQNLANDYLRRLFDVASDAPIPPFIAVHARRGDFFNYCDGAGVARDACYPSMAEYSTSISTLRSAIHAKLGVDAARVVMLSDEVDEKWWDGVRAQGWAVPRDLHAEIMAERGMWYTVLLDAVMLSSGVGLLGTPGSTFSLVAGRRVMDWHGGVYHEIAWAARPRTKDDPPMPVP